MLVRSSLLVFETLADGCAGGEMAEGSSADASGEEPFGLDAPCQAARLSSMAIQDRCPTGKAVS